MMSKQRSTPGLRHLKQPYAFSDHDPGSNDNHVCGPTAARALEAAITLLSKAGPKRLPLELIQRGKAIGIEQKREPLSRASISIHDRIPPRPWKNAFAEDGGPTSAVKLRRGVRADPGTQARIACSSGPTPMIAITRFML